MAKVICSVETCDRTAVTRGWCSRHYQRWYLHGGPLNGGPDHPQARFKPECSIDGCEKGVAHGGLCIGHAKRLERHGDPFGGGLARDHRPFADRFMDNVEVMPNGCWRWTAHLTEAGYAWARADGVSFTVYRWTCEHFNGPIPEGYEVDHACHNADPDCPPGVCAHRACVNPAHLEAVTYLENMRRTWVKRRQWKGRPR